METKKAIEFLEKRDRIFLYGGSTQYMSELNKAIDQIIISSQRGEKYEAMWREMYKNWGEYPIELHDIAEFMDDTEQKYFPKETDNETEIS